MQNISPADAQNITQSVIEKYHEYVNPTQVALLKMGGFDHVEWDAQGCVVRDIEGTEYIDCLGGYGVFSLGHRHPKVLAAVRDQLERIVLSTKTFLNKPLADLAERLAQISPGSLRYSFICNSGAEAVEAALKFARMATGKPEIIATNGGFHGKTMGALTATGRQVFRTPFEPLLPGFTSVAYNDASAVAASITEHTAAVIVEPVQGEGGIIVPSSKYLPDLRQICTDNGVLLILDEVQTGLGRTGKMFACEHCGVEPDLMTLAKALGGGVMPIGATLGTADIWDRVFAANPFIHTSTFGGSELACRAAIAAIEATIDEDLANRAASLGVLFLDGLSKMHDAYPELIVDVRGLGLMIGVEFRDADIAKIVIGTLVHNGVIAAYTLNNPNVIRFEPPLIITPEQIEYVLIAVERGLAEANEILRMLE